MDKPALRNALKKLRALPLDPANHPNVMMAPQEMLDYLAMLSGFKPVFLLGRGFDDPDWVAGAAAMARKAGFHVIEGPQWNVQTRDETIPDWFQAHLDAQGGNKSVFYVCRAKGTADAVQASIDKPPITMEEEARLLGYPPCCVKAHYDRDRAFSQLFFKLVHRAAGGDEAEMRRILEEDIAVAPETPQEEAAMKEAMTFKPVPFTSFHMCKECAADENGPAMKLAKRYEELADAVDHKLGQQIAANQKGVGAF